MTKVLLLLFFSTSLLFSETIFINKIKFSINDELYIWKDDLPASQKPGETSPEFLQAFISIQPGDELTLEKLDRVIESATLRLKESNLFYSISISIIPPRKYPNKRTILISVTDGFVYRFGGGKSYGFFGSYNFMGMGDQFTLFGGLNKVALNYKSSPRLNRFRWGSFNEYNPEESQFETHQYVGYQPHPDLWFSSGLKWDTEEFWRVSLKEYFKKSWYVGGDTLLALKINNELLLWEDSELLSDLSLSSSFSNNLEFYNKVFYNSKFYGVSKLYYNYPRLIFPPMFNIQISNFIFINAQLSQNRVDDLYGIGLRIYFDVPIFTTFTFTYGWRITGEGVFDVM